MKRLVFVLVAALPLAGCDGSLFGVSCTAILLPNLNVEVRDSLTGAAAAEGATGWATGPGGMNTQLTGGDSLRLFGDWGREQAGRYVVTIRKPGFKTVSDTTEVDEDRCHVKTKTVRVDIVRDPSTVVETPIQQAFGTHVSGSGASAGIRVLGDTLEITGMATSRCRQLRVVASRGGNDWHIQLEPGAPVAPCTAAPMQPFMVRYRLQPGSNALIVTGAYDFPPLLFQGRVTPAS